MAMSPAYLHRQLALFEKVGVVLQIVLVLEEACPIAPRLLAGANRQPHHSRVAAILPRAEEIAARLALGVAQGKIFDQLHIVRRDNDLDRR